MPEIWLNYGNNDVVLDILAENLDEKAAFDSKTMDESLINEKLESIDLSKAFARYQIMRCSSLYPKGKNTCASLIF